MAIASAGILMYHHSDDGIDVVLVHPGGPYWSKRDLGAWSIPKGEMDDEEDAENAARREFAEELGVPVHGSLQPLGSVRQRAGRIVYGYALEGNLDIDNIHSNNATIEWPPRSGRIVAFPEIDRAAWFVISLAREKLLAGQRPFLDRLEDFCRTLPQNNQKGSSMTSHPALPKTSDAKAGLVNRSNELVREFDRRHRDTAA
jgi:predicted NUDIX family NTP pyrophosphohydrolase